MPRTVDKVERRAQLVDAAQRAFAARGVANTAVSHIVEEAGVAKGTFYLYFDSKDEVLVAVAERMVDGVLDAAEGALDGEAGAVSQLRALIGALGTFDGETGVMEVAEVIHRPENRLLHDRLEERFTPRLVPVMESIVTRGVEEDVFDVVDVTAASWFVLGGLHGAELAETPMAEMPGAMAAATELALRALGYAGAGAGPGSRGAS